MSITSAAIRRIQILGILFQSPILGGNSRQIIKDIDSSISFAPDGQRFAFIRANSPSFGQFQILSGDQTAGQASVVFTGSNQPPKVSAWSPDGKEIAAQLFQEGDSLNALATIGMNGGKPKIFFSTKLNIISNPTWLPGGKGLLVLYSEIVAFNDSVPDRHTFLTRVGISAESPMTQIIIRT